MGTRKLWIGFIAVIIFSFSVLGFFGHEIYVEAPPIPEKVVADNGAVLFTAQDIRDGQNIWQSIGGQELGTIWGHGSYVAPDWTADYLHREARFILDQWAHERFNSDYDHLSDENKAVLQVDLKKELRTNTYDPGSQTLKVSPVRAKAMEELGRYYTGLFMADSSLDKTREAYAIPVNTIKEQSRMDRMNAFFFWASWACITQRPDKGVTYTNNWPPDELVGNKPAPSLILWTGFSVIMLLAGIGIMLFYQASIRDEELLPVNLPANDPLSGSQPTPSMKAVEKYFWVVCGLILVQILMGVITAHYGVEGNAFYGLSATAGSTTA